MILITGGLGYVGSFTCKFLSKKNKPFSIDDLSRGNSFSGKYCKNFKVNIGDDSKVSKIIKKIRLIQFYTWPHILALEKVTIKEKFTKLIIL